MMNFLTCRTVLVTLGAVAACNGSRDGNETAQPTAATLGEQEARTAAEYLARQPFATSSPALGDRLLMQCRACHTLARDDAHRIGPNLYGVFGRQAGSVPGFNFSPALAAADFVWTPRALDAWLAGPAQFLPGNRMIFPGVPDAADRAALIASLLRQTAAADEVSTTRDLTSGLWYKGMGRRMPGKNQEEIETWPCNTQPH